MKFLQVLLIFVIAMRWTSGDRSDLINNKKLKEIYSSMNVSAEACDNFFEYACGESVSRDDVDVELIKDMINYIENINFNNKPAFVKMAYDLYTSCNVMDTEDWNADFYMEWFENNEDIVWALLPHSNETMFDWVHTLGVTIRYNLNDIFVKVEVIDDEQGGPTKVVIGINKSIFKAEKINEENLEEFFEKLPNLGYSVETLWPKISSFQMHLQHLRKELEWESERKQVNIEDLKQPWLQQLIPQIMNSEDEKYELYVENVEYFDLLDDVLSLYDDRFLAAFLELNFLMKFYEQIPVFKPRQCMSLTANLMPLAVNYIYELHNPDLQDQIPLVQEVFDNIIDGLNETLSKAETGLVSENLLRKIAKVQLKVGNLPRVNKVETLEKYYADLEVSSDDFNLNHIRLLEFAFKIGRKYNQEDLAGNMDTFFDAEAHLTAHPYWVTSTDILVIPSFLLRQPLYHWGYDNHYLYSGLGMYIALAVFAEMHYKNIPKTHAQNLVMVTLLHSPYRGYYRVASDELDETHTIEDMDLTAKQLYFLNSAQFFCGADAAPMLNDAVSFIEEFAEAFECKTYGYMKFVNTI